MNLSKSSSNQAGMGLRCKDGDMAVIVGDVPGCEGNVGRIVQVRGPTTQLIGYICWQIKPLDKRLLFIRDHDGSIVGERVVWKSKFSILIVFCCLSVRLKTTNLLKPITT